MNVKIMPTNLKLEAYSILSRLAYTGKEPFLGDIQICADYYAKKYHIDINEFIPLIEVYNYVKNHVDLDYNELMILFGQPTDSAESLANTLFNMENSLGSTLCQDLAARILFFSSSYYDELGITKPITDLNSFLTMYSELSLPPDVKWLYLDACINYDKYVLQINKIVSKVSMLLEDKIHLLQPFNERCIQALEKFNREGILLDKFAKKNLKLDIDSMVIYPVAMKVASITMSANDNCTRYLDILPMNTFVYGSLVDCISESLQVDFNGRLYNYLHALDDKSRLQILSELKKRPLYNQEISELLGLSSATITHHMSELISVGFVTMEKQGVRVFYNLNNDNIRNAIDILSGYLL